jgi:hypothetical protein
LIDCQNARHEEEATGNFWKSKDAADERDKKVELHFYFKRPGDEEERIMLTVEDEAMTVNEAGGVVWEPAHEAVLIDGDGEDEEESERDEVRNFDADEATTEVLFDERFLFTVEVMGGVGKGENKAGDEKENLHPKPAASDEGMRGVFETLDWSRIDEFGDGGGFISSREKSVRVEDYNKKDGKTAETIDFREVAPGGGLALEGSEETVGPRNHFLFCF